MPDATEPVAWAIYGRVTGNLKYVVTDDTEATDLAEFYDVVPLVPAPMSAVSTNLGTPEGLCGVDRKASIRTLIDAEDVLVTTGTCVFLPNHEGKHSWQQ